MSREAVSRGRPYDREERKYFKTEKKTRDNTSRWRRKKGRLILIGIYAVDNKTLSDERV